MTGNQACCLTCSSLRRSVSLAGQLWHAKQLRGQTRVNVLWSRRRRPGRLSAVEMPVGLWKSQRTSSHFNVSLSPDGKGPRETWIDSGGLGCQLMGVANNQPPPPRPRLPSSTSLKKHSVVIVAQASGPHLDLKFFWHKGQSRSTIFQDSVF